MAGAACVSQLDDAKWSGRLGQYRFAVPVLHVHQEITDDYGSILDICASNCRMVVPAVLSRIPLTTAINLRYANLVIDSRLAASSGNLEMNMMMMTTTTTMMMTMIGITPKKLVFHIYQATSTQKSFICGICPQLSELSF